MTALSTVPAAAVTSRSSVQFDLYRDVHKGIRAELFAVTEEAGRVDPCLPDDRAALATHVADVAELLHAHARHEDFVRPALEAHLPDLAAQMDAEHEILESHLDTITTRARVEVTESSARRLAHDLYLDLATFTRDYLTHQDVEEAVVMPALESAIGVEAVLGIHEAILASIPPERFARVLAVMLPAMNIDDRSELLAGVRVSAPPEAFDSAWSLTGSVLPASEHTALAARLGLP
jgi:hypothetical protein